MSCSISGRKANLRRECLRLRTEIRDAERHSFGESICDHLENWRPFQESQCILTYLPMRGEVDLAPLFVQYPNKQWVVPRIVQEDDHRMIFHRYDANHLVMHHFGMAEPDSSQPIIPPEQIQLALVPGVAYDTQGWRLGYGGGYFDRFLGGFSGISVGITYYALLVDNLPHDSFDIQVHWIVTERGILGTSQGYNRTTYVRTDLS